MPAAASGVTRTHARSRRAIDGIMPAAQGASMRISRSSPTVVGVVPLDAASCRSANEHGDALHGVVLVAAEVPCGLERLGVSGPVRGSAAEHVRPRFRVPRERPATPGPWAVELAGELRVGPGTPAVGA